MLTPPPPPKLHRICIESNYAGAAAAGFSSFHPYVYLNVSLGPRSSRRGNLFLRGMNPVRVTYGSITTEAEEAKPNSEKDPLLR